VSSPATTTVKAYDYKVVGTAKDGTEIRKFANAQLASAIDAAIASANLKSSQTAAVIVTYHDPTATEGATIRGAVMVRKEVGTWWNRKIEFTFAGVVTHDFSSGDTRKEAGMVIRI
jgi:hypothetical protein